MFIQSSGGVIERNTIMLGQLSKSFGAVVDLQNGADTTVADNTIDGGYIGQCNDCAADDGIVLSNESRDTVRGNTIANVFDAGIESVGPLSNTTIADNTITNAAFTGVGAYWCTYWQGNTVSGNSVRNSATVIFMNYSWDPMICAGVKNTPGYTSGRFVSNTLSGNTLSAAIVRRDNTGLVLQFVMNDAQDENATVVTTNNVLEGNDVGALKIYALPASGFENGGGNVCGPNGPFTC